MSEVKNVITVTDRSTKALTTASTALTKVAADLAGLVDSSTKLATEIEFRQSDLDNINVQFDTKFREATAEFKLKVLENEDKVLDGILKSRGLTTIAPNALSDLQYQLDAATASNEQELAAAEQKGANDARRAYQAELSNVQSNHKVEIAQLNANATAAAQRIEFLTEQNDSLKEQIREERETRLAIAQADAGRQGVVVNNGK